MRGRGLGMWGWLLLRRNHPGLPSWPGLPGRQLPGGVLVGAGPGEPLAVSSVDRIGAVAPPDAPLTEPGTTSPAHRAGLRPVLAFALPSSLPGAGLAGGGLAAFWWPRGPPHSFTGSCASRRCVGFFPWLPLRVFGPDPRWGWRVVLGLAGLRAGWGFAFG